MIERTGLTGGPEPGRAVQAGAAAPSGRAAPGGPAARTVPAAGADRQGRPVSFQAVLRQKVERGLRWSRHAEERLRQAGVELGQGDVEAITEAVDALERRGARDGLVVYGDLALVVSVRNRTVITAARPERLDDGVFTQIDGAAVIREQAGAGPRGAAAGAGEAPSPWNDGSGLILRRSMVR